MTEVSKSNGKPESSEISTVDKQAEEALLGSMICEPKCIEPVFDLIGPDCFYLGSSRTIARAIQMLSRESVPLNIVTIAAKLRSMGKLEQAGGSVYLARLCDETPSLALDDVLSYAQIVRDKWVLSAAKAEAQALVAKIETGSIGDIGEAFRSSSEQITQITQVVDDSDFGFWGTELGDPNEEPPRESWLLFDEITGKPALPLGRAAMLSASGGTGKTTSLCQLAVSVALGLPWCGFTVKQTGCVVLACGESDQKLMRRHLWRAFNSLELDADQRAQAMHNILVLPLMGREVNMLSGIATGNIERTDFLRQFAKRLTKLAIEGKFDWTLVILDPLSRFAGADTESNNAAATRFAQAVETLCNLPGNPTIVCAHHSSKASIRDGANDSRGVSGLRDAFRAVFVMTRFKTEGLVAVHMTCDKSNEAPHFSDRWLIQGIGEVGGTLRLASDPEASMLNEEAEKRSKKRRTASSAPAPDKSVELKGLILKRIADERGQVKSTRWLEDRIKARATDIREAVREMIADGLLTRDESGQTKGTLRRVGADTQMELPLN